MEVCKTTVIHYGNGIYALDQGMVRAFLVVGSSRALLLDTGAVRAQLLPMLQAITALPVTVILTHGDGDHVGNLQDFPEAFIHPDDMDAVLAHEACRNVRLRPIAAGDVFDLGDRKLEVLLTPGHTAGSVSLLDHASGVLFAGDTVSYGPVFMFGARRNMQTYLETLQRLQTMQQAGVYKTVYCCHNTCPIGAETVGDLVACVSGILDKAIPGVPAPMPVPTADKPLLAGYGNCKVLF